MKVVRTLYGLLLGAQVGACAKLQPRVAAAASASPTTTGLGPCMQTSYTVPNGDFEGGSLDPWIVHTTYNTSITLVSPGNGDGSAVLIQAVGSGAVGGLRNAHTPVCGAAEYGLTWTYRINASAPGCFRSIAVGVLGKTLQHRDVEFAVTDGWQVATPLQFTLLAQESFGFYVGMYADIQNASSACSSAAVEYDLFEVAYVASADPPGCPLQPYIDNGDFESGSLEPWVVDPYSTNASVEVVSPGYNGSEYMARMSFNAMVNGSTVLTGISTTLHNMCADYTYNFSLDYQITGDIDSAQFMEYCTAGVYNKYCTGDFGFSFAEGWQHLSAQCVGRRNDPNVTMEISAYCQDPYDPSASAPAWSIDLDNIQIVLAQ